MRLSTELNVWRLYSARALEDEENCGLSAAKRLLHVSCVYEWLTHLIQVDCNPPMQA